MRPIERFCFARNLEEKRRKTVCLWHELIARRPDGMKPSEFNECDRIQHEQHESRKRRRLTWDLERMYSVVSYNTGMHVRRPLAQQTRNHVSLFPFAVGTQLTTAAALQNTRSMAANEPN